MMMVKDDKWWTIWWVIVKNGLWIDIGDWWRVNGGLIVRMCKKEWLWNVKESDWMIVDYCETRDECGKV
jgi:hypothetical protein